MYVDCHLLSNCSVPPDLLAALAVGLLATLFPPLPALELALPLPVRVHLAHSLGIGRGGGAAGAATLEMVGLTDEAEDAAHASHALGIGWALVALAAAFDVTPRAPGRSYRPWACRPWACRAWALVVVMMVAMVVRMAIISAILGESCPWAASEHDQ